MKNNTTENNHEPTQIELSVVTGEASGLFSFTEPIPSCRLAEDLTFEQWREIGRTIKFVRKYSDIAAADWVKYGFKKWGKKKTNDALEQLEMEATLVKAAIAINAIPQELRLENLDGDHYVELAKAKLPRSQTIHWARIASQQRLTASQLRFSILEGEVVDPATARQERTGVYTIQGVRQSFDVWHRRVGGIEGVKKMELDHKIEIMEELDAICEFGTDLHEHLSGISEATAA